MLMMACQYAKHPTVDSHNPTRNNVLLMEHHVLQHTVLLALTCYTLCSAMFRSLTSVFGGACKVVADSDPK